MSPRGGKGSRKRRIRRPSRPKMRSGVGSSRGKGRSGIESSRSRSHSGVGSSSRSKSSRRRSTMGRRPVWRPRGRSYHRRYRARPMSSGACLCVFAIIAIFLIIVYAPSFIFALAPDFSFVVLVAAAAGIILLAMLFITALDIGDDGDSTPTATGDTRVVERERVLVVCPYCGTKNEQGISKCTNCDGEL